MATQSAKSINHLIWKWLLIEFDTSNNYVLVNFLPVPLFSFYLIIIKIKTILNAIYNKKKNGIVDILISIEFKHLLDFILI
jgi:hypothetical protein